MPDVLTTAILHPRRSLACRLAERWPSMPRRADERGGAPEIWPRDLVKARCKRLGRAPRMKSGLDFSIGEIPHSPRLG
jgi:hypothetical protein